jgi:peptide/nickel transport system substrate-binding protein
MINPLRERVWYIKGFISKYFGQILFSLALTILIVFLGSFILAKIPQAKPHYRIGIVGQFGAGQLPPYIMNFLKAGLVILDNKHEPQPGLAEKWDISPDGKTYTFYLRPGLKWNDGQAVTATDIKISIPNIDVETTDPNLVRFQIPTKFSPFLSLLNIPLLNSEGKIIGKSDIRLKQKSSGIISQIIVTTPDKTLIFNVFQTPKQAIVAFKLGQIDLALNLPSEYLDEVAGYGQINEQVDLDRVIMLVFSQQDQNLKEKSVRQGIAYSLSDKNLGQTEAITTISPASWAFNPLVKTYPHNPQRTKDLIKEPISLELATTPELLSIAEKLKEQLSSEQISINTKVVTSTPDQFQLLLTSYNIPSDPDQYRDWHSTQATNIGRGSDEKIDKLLEDGRITMEQKERKRIYFDFQKTFAEELPALVLYHPTVFNLARKDAYFKIINTGN